MNIQLRPLAPFDQQKELLSSSRDKHRTLSESQDDSEVAAHKGILSAAL